MQRSNPHFASILVSLFAMGVCLLTFPALDTPQGARANFGWAGIVLSAASMALALWPFTKSRATAIWWIIVRSVSVCLCALFLIVTLATYYVWWQLS